MGLQFDRQFDYNDKLIVASLFIVFIMLVIFSVFRGPQLDPSAGCPSTLENGRRIGKEADGKSHSHASPDRIRIDAKVLLFVETQYSHRGREIAELLVHNRIKYSILPFS